MLFSFFRRRRRCPQRTVYNIGLEYNGERKEGAEIEWARSREQTSTSSSFCPAGA